MSFNRLKTLTRFTGRGTGWSHFAEMIFISGTISIIITPTGNLKAKGKLSGTITIILTPSGDISAQQVFNQITGVINISLTPSGSLQKGAGFLSGIIFIRIVPRKQSDSLIINPLFRRGVRLPAKGKLSGTINIVFKLSGYLIQTVPIVDCDVEILYPIQPVVKSNMKTFRKDSMEWENTQKSDTVWRHEMISFRFRLQDILMSNFIGFHIKHKAEIVLLKTPGVQPFIRSESETQQVRIIKIGAPKKSMPRKYDMSVTYLNTRIFKPV